VMVIDRFEVSLDELVRKSPLDTGTVVSYAEQMVSTSLKVHIEGN